MNGNNTENEIFHSASQDTTYYSLACESDESRPSSSRKGAGTPSAPVFEPVPSTSKQIPRFKVPSLSTSTNTGKSPYKLVRVASATDDFELEVLLNHAQELSEPTVPDHESDIDLLTANERTPIANDSQLHRRQTVMSLVSDVYRPFQSGTQLGQKQTERRKTMQTLFAGTSLYQSPLLRATSQTATEDDESVTSPEGVSNSYLLAARKSRVTMVGGDQTPKQLLRRFTELPADSRINTAMSPRRMTEMVASIVRVRKTLIEGAELDLPTELQERGAIGEKPEEEKLGSYLLPEVDQHMLAKDMFGPFYTTKKWKKSIGGMFCVLGIALCIYGIVLNRVMVGHLRKVNPKPEFWDEFWFILLTSIPGFFISSAGFLYLVHQGCLCKGTFYRPTRAPSAAAGKLMVPHDAETFHPAPRVLKIRTSVANNLTTAVSENIPPVLEQDANLETPGGTTTSVDNRTAKVHTRNNI